MGEISAASRGLLDVPRSYTPAFLLTDYQLSKIVHAKWFHERVFDIYLWETGAKDKGEG